MRNARDANRRRRAHGPQVLDAEQAGGIPMSDWILIGAIWVLLAVGLYAIRRADRHSEAAALFECAAHCERVGQYDQADAWARLACARSPRRYDVDAVIAEARRAREVRPR